MARREWDRTGSTPLVPRSRCSELRVLSALAIVCALLAPGCYYGAIQPRTAELAPPGALRGALDLPIYAHASALVTPTDGPRTRSNSGLRGQPIVPIVAPLAPVANLALTGRLGLVPGLELGAILGMQQLGMELRTGLQEGRLALSASFGGLYRPLDDPTSVLLRAGIDLSYRAGAAGRASPLLNFMISNGPEAHLLDGERLGYCGSDDFVACSVVLTRRETRLSVAAGIAFAPGEKHDSRVVLSVVPYVTLWADPEHRTSCTSCTDGGDPQIDRFEENWGGYVTLGVIFGE